MAMTHAQLGIIVLAAQEIRDLYSDGDEKVVSLCLGVVLTATAVGIKGLEKPVKDRVFGSIHEMLQREIELERHKNPRRSRAFEAIETALRSILYTL